MSVQEKDWLESLERQKERKRKDEAVAIGLLKQAAVDAQYLTGREEWDKYLRMLQNERNVAQQELAGVHAQLAAPLSSDALRLLYVKLNVITERIRIVDWCMALPKTICKDAAKVTE